MSNGGVDEQMSDLVVEGGGAAQEFDGARGFAAGGQRLGGQVHAAKLPGANDAPGAQRMAVQLVRGQRRRNRLLLRRLRLKRPREGVRHGGGGGRHGGSDGRVDLLGAAAKAEGRGDAAADLVVAA